MRVSDYIAEKLADEGINQLFSVTGGGAMYLNDSFGHNQRLSCIYQHHEQACAMAAEAYARYSNRMAAVCVTSGPGATNALTGVLGAWMESLPMIVFSGQVRVPLMVESTGLNIRAYGVQEYPVIPTVRPMTKYAVSLTKVEEVRYHLERALYVSRTGRKGPVWLEVPMDVQAMEIDPEELRAYDPKEDAGQVPQPIPDEVITEVLERLVKAERPVLFAGFGIRHSGGMEIFRKLIRTLGIPVLTGMSSVDLVEEQNPYYAGRSGMTGSRAGNFAMQNSDVYLSIGSRQSVHQTGFDAKSWTREAYTILNDVDAEELKKPNLHVSLPVIGDAAEFMQKLYEGAKKLGADEDHPLCKVEPWVLQCRKWREQYPVAGEKQTGPQPDGKANIYRFARDLSRALPKEATLVLGVGTSRVAASQVFETKKGQRVIVNSATASMGYELPAALGVSIAKGKGEVSILTGEGSLMMNLQELQSIITNHLPVRIFLNCNGGYHTCRLTQKNFFGEPLIDIGPESGDLSFPEPEKIAAAFGFGFARIRSNEEIEEKLPEILKMPLPLICAVDISPLQITQPKAASRRIGNGALVSAPLEDLSPFLDRKELEENLYIPMTDGEKER